MDQHSSRRTRSPPFGYDSRTMMNDRDFDEPYNSYEGPSRQHLLPQISGIGLPPGSEPPDSMGMPFMMHTQRHSYASNYRDNRLPSTYRQTLQEPYSVAGPPSRSSSPSYKILCITNINTKIDDLSVKNALMSDFSRFGDVSVSICHDSGERLAYIYFRSYEEAREARLSKSRTIFFDRPIEIEPIYEPGDSPVDGPSPPLSYPQTMIPQQPGMYSPRSRRSMTPLDYHYEMNGPPSTNRRNAMPVHLHNPHALTPPMPISHRPLSPSEYPPLHPVTGYGSHGPSPSLIEPGTVPPTYERREDYGGYMPTSHISPYSSPAHDPYRSPFPPGHRYSPPPYMGSGPQPQQPPPLLSRADRDRLYTDNRYPDPRSPHANDPFYLTEHRGSPAPPPHPYHPSSRSSGHHKASPGNHSVGRAGPYPSAASAAYRHRPVSPPHQYSPHHSYNRPDPPMRFMSREYRRERYGINDSHGNEQDDGRPSRVLLINNIDSSKTEADLRDLFEPLGIIEEIEVKRIRLETSSALIRFSSMDAAYKAKTANHGRYIGNSKCSIVYGKVSASRRLWIGGLSSSTTLRSLEDECSKYGDLINMEYTSGRPYSYVEFETPNQAQFAAYHLRSTLVPAPDRKIRIEFVDPERSERMLRHDANPQTSDTKSRTTNESWASNDRETSSSPMVARKRSSSPLESVAKRICPVNDISPDANTFKHERLAAAATVKARSLLMKSPSIEKSSESSMNPEELNSSSGNRMGNGNLTTNTSQSFSEHTDDSEKHYETPSLEMLAKCSSVREIVSCCSVSWPSLIALRNFTFPSRIHLCSGSKEVVGRYLTKSTSDNDGQSLCPFLRITQRWRMHPQPKLEEVKRRMQSGNIGMLIITSRQEKSAANLSGVIRNNKTELASEIRQKNLQNGGGKIQDISKTEASVAGGEAQKQTPTLHEDLDMKDDVVNKSVTAVDNAVSRDPAESDTAATGQSSTPSASSANTQSRPLRNLISYLEQKDAAGVISLNPLTDASGAFGNQTNASGLDGSKLLYTFPPGEFALNLIKRMASNLPTEVSREEFLLGVIVGGSVESKA